MTPLELRVRALADRGTLTTDSAAQLLPPVEIDLGAIAATNQAPEHEGCAGIGGPEGAENPSDRPAEEGRVFAVQLFNPGPLEAAWELHSYDDPEVGCGEGAC